MKYEARCYSHDCAKFKDDYEPNGGTLKKVPFSTTFCKECGSALVWSKKGKMLRNQSEKIYRKKNEGIGYERYKNIDWP